MFGWISKRKMLNAYRAGVIDQQYRDGERIRNLQSEILLLEHEVKIQQKMRFGAEAFIKENLWAYTRGRELSGNVPPLCSACRNDLSETKEATQ